MSEPRQQLPWPWKFCTGTNCRKRVLFLRTERKKWIPVDANEDGLWPDEREIFNPSKHRPHHASCVDVQAFRKPRR